MLIRTLLAALARHRSVDLTNHFQTYYYRMLQDHLRLLVVAVVGHHCCYYHLDRFFLL